METIGPDGALSSRFSYDTQARVTRFTDSTGAVTVTRYNDLGQTVAETDARGHTVLFTRDRYDDLPSRTDELANTAEFGYDAAGAPATVTFPDGVTEHRVNDPAGLTLSATDPQGAVYALNRDAFGRPIESTDPLGSVTDDEYDPIGRRTAKHRIAPEGPPPANEKAD
ncbi:hypothetical protein ACH41E_23730 [Streptomyces sp. NPDC020412]|uniref:hypothetical protein n=1 Tax=Streptomyces sp. NPDC020412 TaxID=3365073 RepID=UPI0037AF0F51